VPSARIYPDQPQGINRNNGKWELGHKEFRYAVVPEVAGELVLPELKLEWWDTVNDRMQTATLPEQRLKVLPSTIVPASPAGTQAVVAPPGAAVVANGQDWSPGWAPPAPSYWKYLTVLFAALWLGTCALLWRRTSVPQADDEEQEDIERTESVLLRRLKSGCAAGNASQARQSLISWLRTYGAQYHAGAPSGGLLEFAAHLPPGDLAEGLLRLDAMGFRPGQDHGSDGGSDGGWDGAGFWKAFVAWRKSLSRQPADKGVDVTDLYADVRPPA